MVAWIDRRDGRTAAHDGRPSGQKHTPADYTCRATLPCRQNRTAWPSARNGTHTASISSKYPENGRSPTIHADLYGYGLRYYQPEAGRWVSRDPIEERGGIALYLGVLNDPEGVVDILGRDPRIGGPGDYFEDPGMWGSTDPETVERYEEERARQHPTPPIRSPSFLDHIRPVLPFRGPNDAQFARQGERWIDNTRWFETERKPVLDEAKNWLSDRIAAQLCREHPHGRVQYSGMSFSRYSVHPVFSEPRIMGRQVQSTIQHRFTNLGEYSFRIRDVSVEKIGEDYYRWSGTLQLMDTMGMQRADAFLISEVLHPRIKQDPSYDIIQHHGWRRPDAMLWEGTYQLIGWLAPTQVAIRGKWHVLGTICCDCEK